MLATQEQFTRDVREIERRGLLYEHISLGYAEHEQDWLERLLIFT